MFNMEWKYKINITDNDVFDAISKEYNIAFDEAIKNLFIEANAASPVKHLYMLGCNEKIFGGILSLNQGESDTDSIYTALKCITDHTLIPFGIDPFGNYIAYSSTSKEVIFYNHETAEAEVICVGLEKFIDSLY